DIVFRVDRHFIDAGGAACIERIGNIGYAGGPIERDDAAVAVTGEDAGERGDNAVRTRGSSAAGIPGKADAGAADLPAQLIPRASVGGPANRGVFPRRIDNVDRRVGTIGKVIEPVCRIDETDVEGEQRGVVTWSSPEDRNGGH